MDYVVHINDGAQDVKPIVLSLLPGEEIIFELKLVNHGDSSNISIDASPPLIKAMRLKRSNHYVVIEEIIPVLARMPDNVERLDGELLLTSERGTIRVPISLISEDDVVQGKDDRADEEEDEDPPGEVDIEQEDEGKEADFSGARDLQNYHGAARSRDLGHSPGEESRYPESQGQRRSWDAPGYRNGSNYSSQSYEPYGQDASHDSSSIEAEEEDSQDKFSLGLAGDWSAAQIIPALLLLMIILTLVLTFYTSVIPEFPGALASSILIVTLIIYGAATLLKA